MSDRIIEPRTVLPRDEFLAGVRAELPILLGVIPFGLIFGAVAVSAGLPVSLAQAMSVVIFAGSAQFIAAELIGVGTPALVLLLTTLIVNLRHLLYSASLAPHVNKLPLRWKMLLAYLMTDEAYAVTIIHYTEGRTP
ncbi:MAG TPA: AzlC family ABC transporter permease, partial [Promineifilum sp.]|nr:AzlC family ABC transporter permease [Promineifilum sp.]